ncbi:unnamed protein product [Lactuca saligna]|uniref:Uncharacterized protein n=1 Tax=Lactuca saligna TaxID=75948 RepID=A0AA35YW74_LACSI|nr:unnamed protein product [Lactuca saligna]
MLSGVLVDHPIIIEYLKTVVSTGDAGSNSIHESEIPKKKAKSSKRIGMKPTTVSKPIQTSLVSSHMESEAKIYKQVVDDPFLNLSQTPLTPPIIFTTSQSTPIPTKPPIEASTFESHEEENRTADIPSNTSDVGPHVNIEFHKKDDSESSNDFFTTDFSFQEECDKDDDALMTKGKGDLKIVSEKLDELNPPLTKEQQDEQVKRDAFLGALNALNENINAEEVEKKNDESIVANKIALCPFLPLERINDEALKKPKAYWLELQTSFSVEDDLECELDFPITTKAFQFHCFESIYRWETQQSIESCSTFM